MKKLILSVACLAALGACGSMDRSGTYGSGSSSTGSYGSGSTSTGASSMGSTGSGTSSTEPGGTAGANRAQTTSGAYTAPGTSTMPGSKGTAGAPADPNSANPSGMGTGSMSR